MAQFISFSWKIKWKKYYTEQLYMYILRLGERGRGRAILWGHFYRGDVCVCVVGSVQYSVYPILYCTVLRYVYVHDMTWHDMMYCDMKWYDMIWYEVSAVCSTYEKV